MFLRVSPASPAAVPRMLRNAISAFRRVFDTRWCCAADPGSTPIKMWVPALRRGTTRRTASRTRARPLRLRRRPLRDAIEPRLDVGIGRIERLADPIAEIEPAIQQDVGEGETLAAEIFPP